MTEALVGYDPAPFEVPGPVGSQGITGVVEEGSGRHVDSAFTHSLRVRGKCPNFLFFYFALLFVGRTVRRVFGVGCVPVSSVR